MGTVLVAGILLVVVAAIAASLRRDQKQGKSACGGNCAHCRGCQRPDASRRPNGEQTGY